MEEDLNWMTTKTVTYNDVTYNIDNYYEIPNANGGFLMEIDNNADEASLFYTDKKQCVMFKIRNLLKQTKLSLMALRHICRILKMPHIAQTVVLT